jgi:hypothetical protein
VHPAKTKANFAGCTAAENAEEATYNFIPLPVIPSSSRSVQKLDLIEGADLRYTEDQRAGVVISCTDAGNCGAQKFCPKTGLLDLDWVNGTGWTPKTTAGVATKNVSLTGVLRQN